MNSGWPNLGVRRTGFRIPPVAEQMTALVAFDATCSKADLPRPAKPSPGYTSRRGHPSDAALDQIRALNRAGVTPSQLVINYGFAKSVVLAALRERG